MDFIQNFAIIGLSQIRETAVFAGLPLTEREQERKCGVWIVDINTGQTVAFLSFSEGVQEIFSIQLLPWKYPALLDMNDPLLHTSFSIPDDAIAQFVAPDPKQVKMDQAVGHHRRKEFDKAIALYEECLQDDPKSTFLRYHLGVAYSDQEEWDKAITTLESLVRTQTNHAEAWNSLGHAHAGKLEFEKAVSCYESALKADQQYATAHFNRGCLKLKMGDFKEGWPEYEWRWKMPTFHPFNCPQPMWKGEDISDKTLLIHTEQGNGDAIQFARFLPQVRARCKKLVFVCTEPLRLLFKGMDCIDEVRLPGSLPADLFDVYAPIMSLPGILDITLENLPTQTPYLEIPSSVVVDPLETLGDSKSTKPKIGLIWAGSPTQQINHHRSCPIEAMLELTKKGDAKNTDYDFYSLQIPLTSEHKEQLEKSGVHDLESELVSYAHTGAFIEQMDLVISVCTSVVHLSGALNKKSITLLSPHADWRWMDDDQSTWYPNTKIMRQSKSGDWAELIERVKLEIPKQLK